VSEILDPVGARDHVRALKELLVAAQAGEKTEKLHAMAKKALESFEALDLLPNTEKPLAKLAARLINTGQAFVRGEGEKRDAQGVLVMGDMGMELADSLYAYAEERLMKGE
jgi:hypothetical protein